MNAKIARASALCIYTLSISGLCLGCRLPHDLVLHRTDSVSQRRGKPAPQADEALHSHQAAIRPTATNDKVSQTSSTVQQSSPVQSPPVGWDATNFAAPPLAADLAATMPTPPDQASALDSAASQTSAITESSLALASYSGALPASIPDAMMPNAAALGAPIAAPSDTAVPDIAIATITPTALTPTQTSATGTANATEKGSQSNLELRIENVRPKRGKVKVAVFTDAEYFLNPSFVSQAFELKDDDATASTSLSIDKPCAIAVFQDLDGNGQLTKNLLGIPVEPCAFSNNAVIKRGPPKFSEAMVQPAAAAASPTRVSIRLP